MRSVTQSLVDLLNDFERSILEETKYLKALEEECSQKRNLIDDLEQQVSELKLIISKN
jgi:cell shape-determining protein MreC